MSNRIFTAYVEDSPVLMQALEMLKSRGQTVKKLGQTDYAHDHGTTCLYMVPETKGRENFPGQFWYKVPRPRENMSPSELDQLRARQDRDFECYGIYVPAKLVLASECVVLRYRMQPHIGKSLRRFESSMVELVRTLEGMVPPVYDPSFLLRDQNETMVRRHAIACC